MSIPPPSTNAPVNITCASHVRYLVKDLDESLKFYTEVLGFVVSDQHAKVIYLRGTEESWHHSVVLMQTDGEPTAECLGIRVTSEEDIHRHTNSCGPMVGTAEYVDRLYQGPLAPDDVCLGRASHRTLLQYPDRSQPFEQLPRVEGLPCPATGPLSVRRC